MKTIFALILLAVMTCACGESRTVHLRIVSVDRGAVVVDVVNATSEDIVVLSPEAPSRGVDEGRCVLFISTKVTDDIRPYAFTPTLNTIQAGADQRFRVVLDPVALTTKTCREWTINAEYAYVSPVAVARFQGRPSEDFRQYVLRSQQLMSASATMTVEI